MGARGTRLLILVTALLIPSAAWGEQRVKFASVPLELRYHDTWTVERLDGGDGLTFTRPGPQLVGDVEIVRGGDCARLIEEKAAAEPLPVGPQASVSSAWTGYGYGQFMGYYCRAATLDGVAYAFVASGNMTDLGLITDLVDAGVDRFAVVPSGMQELVLPTTTLVVTVPAGWGVIQVDGKDTIVDAGGGEIAQVLLRDQGCPALLDQARSGPGTFEDRTTDVPGGWTGVRATYEEGDAAEVFCRDLDLSDGRRVQLLVGSYDVSKSSELLAAMNASLERLDKPKPDDTTTHKLYLVGASVRIQVPTNWTSGYNAGFDWISRNGKLVATATDSAWARDCRKATKRAAAQQVPGWTSVEISGDLGYCLDAGKVFVEFQTAEVVDWLLVAIAEAVERKRVAAIPTTFEKFGPNRYELGLGRFDPDPDNILVEDAWGLSAVVGRTPWGEGEPGLAWSYQARVAATGEGTPVAVEAGIGLSLKFLALQGIVGFGSAGDDVSLAPHAGGQLDLLLLRGAPGGGFDFSVSHVWRDGGTATALHGGFILAGSRRCYSLQIGWESKVDTSIVSINVAMMRTPPSWR